MSAELLERLATVFCAGGAALLVTLLCGLWLVPRLQAMGFVSRESKEGVAKGRTDTVPMGGGFILLIGVTLVIVVLTALEQIRRGYAGCFLIAFWGFGSLGYLDDRSKALSKGYSDKVKVLLQITVTLTFAVSFYWYYSTYVKDYQLDYLTIPFIGYVRLNLAVVPAVMLFLFWVSNAVNITDGFNGLAGGTGAIVALAYAVVTFLIGASEWATWGHDTEIAIRMFALSRVSAVIAGSLVAYLYFNFCRGSVYFGDTGSMALGAALAFLAVFSRTEFLLCVIGGVFFSEAVSVFAQRLAVVVSQRMIEPTVLASSEPFRPFVIAPLHHHFEHLLMRELEAKGYEGADVRNRVRARITKTAWVLGLAFGLCGMAAEYGAYRRWTGLYDWACAAGVALMFGVLAFGVLTRYLYDTYFIGPARDGSGTLTLYRGVPWRFLGRPLSHCYERTDIPIAQLGFLEQRTGLFHLFYNRVDARIAFGLLHYEVGRRGGAGQRAEHYARAVAFWEQVPTNRFLTFQRHDVMEQMAAAYDGLGRHADAVQALETLYRDSQHASRPAVLQQIEAIQGRALRAAEVTWAAWSAGQGNGVRGDALTAHQELLALLRIRYERARRVLDRLRDDGGSPPEERLAVERQVDELEQALAVAAERCDALQPAEQADV